MDLRREDGRTRFWIDSNFAVLGNFGSGPSPAPYTATFWDPSVRNYVAYECCNGYSETERSETDSLGRQNVLGPPAFNIISCQSLKESVETESVRFLLYASQELHFAPEVISEATDDDAAESLLVLNHIHQSPTSLSLLFGEFACPTAKPAITMADFWPVRKSFWLSSQWSCFAFSQRKGLSELILLSEAMTNPFLLVSSRFSVPEAVTGLAWGSCL
jgi:hypothetical protein